MEKAQYYRHFKGGLYKFISLAKDSENPDNELVVYQAMYGEKVVWVRPKDMFFSNVERDGYSGPRFIPVEESELEVTCSPTTKRRKIYNKTC